jgi:hypothetical protein
VIDSKRDHNTLGGVLKVQGGIQVQAKSSGSSSHSSICDEAIVRLGL